MKKYQKTVDKTPKVLYHIIKEREVRGIRKKEIIKLDGTKVDHSTIEELQNSEHVNDILYLGGDEYEVILKDWTYIRVHVEVLRRDKWRYPEIKWNRSKQRCN